MTDSATIDAVDRDAEKYRQYQPPPRENVHASASTTALQALDVHALALMQFKMREVILDPWLHSQDLCMVFAARGIGKTHFAIAVAYAVSTGGQFAKWSAPTPRKVL